MFFKKYRIDSIALAAKLTDIEIYVLFSRRCLFEKGAFQDKTTFADVAKLAEAAGLGPAGETRVGSTPTVRTSKTALKSGFYLIGIIYPFITIFLFLLLRIFGILIVRIPFFRLASTLPGSISTGEII